MIMVDEIHKLGATVRDIHSAELACMTISSVTGAIMSKASTFSRDFRSMLQSFRQTGVVPSASINWAGHGSLLLLLEALVALPNILVHGGLVARTNAAGQEHRHASVLGSCTHTAATAGSTQPCMCDLCTRGCVLLEWSDIWQWLLDWGFDNPALLVSNAASVFTMYDDNVQRPVDLERLRPAEAFTVLLHECFKLQGSAQPIWRTLNLRFLPYILGLASAGTFTLGIAAKDIKPYIQEFEAMYRKVVGFSATPMARPYMVALEGWSSLTSSNSNSYLIQGAMATPPVSAGGISNLYARFYMPMVSNVSIEFTKEQLEDKDLARDIKIQTAQEILAFARILAAGRGLVVVLPSESKQTKFFDVWKEEDSNGWSLWKSMEDSSTILVGTSSTTVADFQRALNQSTSKPLLFFIRERCVIVGWSATWPIWVHP